MNNVGGVFRDPHSLKALGTEVPKIAVELHYNTTLAVALYLNLAAILKSDLRHVPKLPAALIYLPPSRTMQIPKLVVNPFGWVVDLLGVSICCPKLYADVWWGSLPFLTVHLSNWAVNPFGWVVNPSAQASVIKVGRDLKQPV